MVMSSLSDPTLVFFNSVYKNMHIRNRIMCDHLCTIDMPTLFLSTTRMFNPMSFFKVMYYPPNVICIIMVYYIMI